MKKFLKFICMLLFLFISLKPISVEAAKAGYSVKQKDIDSFNKKIKEKASGYTVKTIFSSPEISDDGLHYTSSYSKKVANSFTGDSSGNSTVGTAKGSDGSWCKVYINQLGDSNGSAQYAKSWCTMCTMINIIQNSGLITDSKYQMDAGKYGGKKQPADKLSSLSKNDKIFFTMATRNQDGDSDKSFRKVDVGLKGEAESVPIMNSYCSGANWSTFSEGTKGTGGWTFTIGIGDKDFKDMSDKELLEAFQTFYNNGYFAAVGLQNKGGSSSAAVASKGGKDYTARHWVMLSGVDNSDIYFNDSSGGTTHSKFNYYKSYWVAYVVLFKNDKVKMCDLAGGKVGDLSGNGSTSALGIPGQVFAGFCSEQELAQYCILKEANIQEMYLDKATRDGLNSADTKTLSDWEINVGIENEETGLIGGLRVLVQCVGIIFIVWMVLLYLAYWFDRFNTFFDISLLSLLTAKKLVISPNESECNFSVSDLNTGECKTVNHTAIVKICFGGILIGCCVVSGIIFRVLSLIIWFIKDIIS